MKNRPSSGSDHSAAETPRPPDLGSSDDAPDLPPSAAEPTWENKPPLAGAPTLAQKLDHLFQTVHEPGRGPYSNDHVAREISEKFGVKITGQYLFYLRNGQRDNISVDKLRAIARFFGIGLHYFDDDEYAARVDADLQLLASLREAGASPMLMRAADLARLSESSREAIVTMISKALQFEGLDPSTTPPDQEER